MVFNPSLIHLHQWSVQNDTFAYVGPVAGEFWALDWVNGIWLSFRVSSPFPLTRWCTLWLRLFLVLFRSVCHTHKNLAVGYSHHNIFISSSQQLVPAARPSRRDPHRVLRFPQKPRATLYVRVCVCVIMRVDPKVTVWKSSTFPVDYPPIFPHSSLISLRLAYVWLTVWTCSLKWVDTTKKRKIRAVRRQSERLWYFQPTTQALKPLNNPKVSFSLGKRHKVLLLT